MEFGIIDIILTIALGAAIYYAFGLFSQSPPAPASKPTSLTSPKGATKSTDAPVDVPDIRFVFGSESGTAENMAYDLAEEAKLFGFKSTVTPAEELDAADLLNDRFAVFLMATYGEGEPTSNASQLWESWITAEPSNREPSDLSNLTFAVFGLGNRQYRHFNAVGKRLDKELAVAGAERLLPVGLGDDDGTMEDDQERWRGELWQAARLRFMANSSDMDKLMQPQFHSTFDVTIYPQQSEHTSSYQGGLEKVARYFNDPVKEHRTGIVTIVNARELRPAKDEQYESTAHIDISLEGTKLKYRTADDLGVHPRNEYKNAGKLAKRLGIDMKTVFSVKTATGSSRRAPMPNPCSVEDAFLYFLDIQSIVKNKFPAILSTYATDKKEKEKLLYFTNTTEGKEEFSKLRYNWVDLLYDYPSIDIPFSHIIEMIQRLHPRDYTISSSNKINPQQLSITVSRHFGTKPSNNEPYLGIASNFLCNSIDDDNNRKMVVYIKESMFRLPVRAGTPIIMVGPGTGVAPFHAFIQEFRGRAVEHKFGDTILFFGCRHPEKDYIYREEFEQAHKDGVLTHLHVAFSRLPGQNKVYVQDLIKKESQTLWNLIEKGAYIYVCGATAMGRDVLNVFTTICHEYGNMNKAQAEAFVDRMIRQNRYVQELWSP